MHSHCPDFIFMQLDARRLDPCLAHRTNSGSPGKGFSFFKGFPFLHGSRRVHSHPPLECSTITFANRLAPWVTQKTFGVHPCRAHVTNDGAGVTGADEVSLAAAGAGGSTAHWTRMLYASLHDDDELQTHIPGFNCTMSTSARGLLCKQHKWARPLVDWFVLESRGVIDTRDLRSGAFCRP